MKKQYKAKYSRVNGDELTLVFDKHGALSSAIMQKADRKAEVAKYLRGLNQSNAEEYLDFFGFRLSWGMEKLAYLFAEGIIDEPICQIKPHADGWEVLVEEATEEICPCKPVVKTYFLTDE